MAPYVSCLPGYGHLNFRKVKSLKTCENGFSAPPHSRDYNCHAIPFGDQDVLTPFETGLVRIELSPKAAYGFGFVMVEPTLVRGIWFSPTTIRQSIDRDRPISAVIIQVTNESGEVISQQLDPKDYLVKISEGPPLSPVPSDVQTRASELERGLLMPSSSARIKASKYDKKVAA